VHRVIGSGGKNTTCNYPSLAPVHLTTCDDTTGSVDAGLMHKSIVDVAIQARFALSQLRSGES
jgi:hypothetical protein